MNDLPDFIAKHRPLFDQEALPAGHEARFLSKLTQQATSKRTLLRRYPYLGIAATIAAILITGLGIREMFTATNRDAFAMRREEKIEARMWRHYQAQMNAITQQINSYTPLLSDTDREQIEDAITILAQNHVPLMETLPAEAPFAVRRAALEGCYDRNLSGMKQIAALLAQTHL